MPHRPSITKDQLKQSIYAYQEQTEIQEMKKKKNEGTINKLNKMQSLPLENLAVACYKRKTPTPTQIENPLRRKRKINNRPNDASQTP